MQCVGLDLFNKLYLNLHGQFVKNNDFKKWAGIFTYDPAHPQRDSVFMTAACGKKKNILHLSSDPSQGLFA